MKNLIGYFQLNIHKSFRFSLHLYEANAPKGTGFVVGDSFWASPVQFDELFRSGYAWSDIGEIEYYECDETE